MTSPLGASVSFSVKMGIILFDPARPLRGARKLRSVEDSTQNAQGRLLTHLASCTSLEPEQTVLTQPRSTARALSPHNVPRFLGRTWLGEEASCSGSWG